MISKPIFTDYELEEEFPIPVVKDKPSSPVFDALTDGRIMTSDGASIFVETARASRKFERLRAGPGGYVSFLRVSPNGARVAFGDGQSVTLFALATPATASTYPVPSYDAEWADEQWLVISGPEKVVALDTGTGAVVTVIEGRGGAAAGVTLDDGGHLYTGNGFASSETGGAAATSKTGAIKVFLDKDWRATLKGGPALDFEKQGVLVADLLSAGYLGFDDDGNLLIGGGNVFGGIHVPGGGDRGHAAVVSAAAIREALRGGAPVVPGFPPSKLHVFDPDRTPGVDNFYYVDFNARTKELYLSDYGKAEVYAFRQVRARDRILVLDGGYHFGDDPGVFQSAPWVGGAVTFPMRYEWIGHHADSPEVRKVRLLFHTRDIETWGDWEGHRVLLNHHVIGRLKDRGDRRHDRTELHVIAIDRQRFIDLVGPSKEFDLSIVLERQAAHPGCVDDFVLMRIDSLDVVVRAGRK